MKGVIKNISDVITNSSSEVFVMDSGSAHYYAGLENTYDCISISEITRDWIENEGNYEYEMICEVCDLDVSELTSATFFKSTDKHYFGEWCGYPQKEDWLIFVEFHHEIIEEKLIGKYWVDIEDHFEDAYNVSRSARGDSVWSDYRY